MRNLLVILLFALPAFLFGQKRQLSGGNNVAVKQIRGKIIVDKNFRDTFSFTKEWEYPDYTFKDDEGNFQIDEDRAIKAEDTMHLFFTARCTTNVQGGYDIRYCYAEKNDSLIKLTFKDGLPAYASEFYVYIDTAVFWCDVETIYPVVLPKQKKHSTTLKQKLILDKKGYSKGDTIKGYIRMEFEETINSQVMGEKKHEFFLSGYFKTTIM
jgi:hypothetical protein